MTLAEYIAEWMRDYVAPVRTASTQRGYKDALRHLSAGVMGQELGAVSAMQLHQEIMTLWARYPRQGQILYAALHCAMSRAERLGLIERNVMRAIDKPRHQAREALILDTDELRRYVGAAAEDQRAGAALLLMAVCGLRRGEALGLTLDDVDLTNGVIHVERQRQGRALMPCKTARSRRALPVGGWLLRYLANRGPGPVCSLSEVSLTRHHEDALQRAGLPTGVTLHGLRHSCATGMIAAGATMAQVQHYLGHSSYYVTARIYAHTTAETLRPAAAAINRALCLDLAG